MGIFFAGNFDNLQFGFNFLLLVRPCLWEHAKRSEDHRCPNCRDLVVRVSPLTSMASSPNLPEGVPDVPSSGQYLALHFKYIYLSILVTILPVFMSKSFNDY